MKTHLRFLFSLVSVLAIGASACSKKAPPPQPTKAPPAETKPPEAPDAAAPAADAAPAPAADAAAAPAADAAAAPAADAAAAPAADAAPAAGPAPVFNTEGMATPESVLVVSDGYLVSNINGNALDKDDNGFISKLGPDGKVVELKWIDGAKADVELNAPKGKALVGDVLFVADIDVVRKFDAKTGAPLGAIALPNASFLNDVAASPDGKTIYVSDTAIGPDFKPKGTAAIYSITGDEAPKALEIATLGQPNGIAVEATADGDVLYFNGLDDTKAIHRFETKTKAASDIKVPGGQLDGLELVRDGDVVSFIVSSWETGSVYRIEKDGKTRVLASNLKGPADFAVDTGKKLVIVPVFMENRVAAFAL